MPEQEFSGGVQQAKEDDFFYRRERELVERMRSEAKARAALRQLAEVTGICDEVLLRDLQAQGFSPQTVKLLDLTPLLLVAWSDGSVTPQEKAEISSVARLHGLGEGIPGYGQLVGWLETRPSDEFFRVTLQGIRAVLDGLPGEQREWRAREILTRCTQVAKVSGGFLGLGSRISAPERVALLRVAAQLGARVAVQGTGEEELS